MRTSLGPWERHRPGINAIDPAHIAENGRRFLYANGGVMAELTADGLGVKVPPHHAFDPWPVPASMRIECTCLEAPEGDRAQRLFLLERRRGRTADPPQPLRGLGAQPSRRRSVGVFALQPIVHTASRESRWFSVGHGRLVDTPEGRWFMTVHATRMAIAPWAAKRSCCPSSGPPTAGFAVPAGVTAGRPSPCRFPALANYPSPTPRTTHQRRLGLQWAFWHEFDQARFSTGQGVLNLKARGSSLADIPLSPPGRRPLLYRRS